MRVGYRVVRKVGGGAVEPGDVRPEDLDLLLTGEHPAMVLQPTAGQAGCDVATVVAGFVNSTCTAESEFVGTMGREHRTLQQGFTRLCLRWLYHMGQQRHWDLRTEASVDAGRKVIEALGDHGWQLPTI